MLIRSPQHFSTDVLFQSALTFSIICWWGNRSVSEKRKLKKQTKKLVNICNKITGQQQTSLSNVYDRQFFKKAKKISNDHSHFLSHEHELLLSKKRFRIPVCKTNGRRFSFIPANIRLLNYTAHQEKRPPGGKGGLSLIHIWRCRRDVLCRSRWSPYH